MTITTEQSTAQDGNGSQPLRYIPFVGCMISVKYPQMEAAVRRTLDRLGVELVDIDGFTCCPDPIYFKAADKMGWLTVAARNISLAEEAGCDIITMCSGCTSTLCEVNYLLKHEPELKEYVNGRLRKIGRQFAGTISVRHIVTVLRDDVGLENIRQSVTHPLTDVKVAVHYGCHLLKPTEIMGVDDPDRPTLMENLIASTGATPLSHPLHLLCCGRACMNEEMPAKMMFDLLTSVEETGADCLGLICPTCFDQFDLGQIKISRQFKRKFEIPVLYYFQLLGLAQGFTETELGLSYHRIKPDKVVSKLLHPVDNI